MCVRNNELGDIVELVIVSSSKRKDEAAKIAFDDMLDWLEERVPGLARNDQRGSKGRSTPPELLRSWCWSGSSPARMTRTARLTWVWRCAAV